ncbi:MAG: hypothetical protein P8J33_10100, partial [Pirellulaceae bacterium]|nr:hypothetical protein [Pirellulaceae bacterium]
IAAGIVMLIVASRLTIDLPNFKPVMAIAMFAGFLLHRQMLGIGAMVLGMLMADSLIGFYEWQVALVVYAALLLPIFGGLMLRRWKDESLKCATGVLGFAGLAAVNFYVLTTLAVWYFTNWYPTTWEGLGAAFIMGLPFLKWTLLGNTVYSALLFGGLALAAQIKSLVDAKQTTTAN